MDLTTNDLNMVDIIPLSTRPSKPRDRVASPLAPSLGLGVQLNLILSSFHESGLLARALKDYSPKDRTHARPLFISEVASPSQCGLILAEGDSLSESQCKNPPYSVLYVYLDLGVCNRAYYRGG